VPTLGLFAERRASLFEGGLFEGIESFVTVVRDRAGPPGAEHAFRTFQRLPQSTKARTKSRAVKSKRGIGRPSRPSRTAGDSAPALGR
jgi:hypothetical protein